MKITCQSCQSKYNVADEKVQGKIVKIRCRKCGATIVVQGTAEGAKNGSASADATGPSLADDGTAWHVNVGDAEPRTMTLGELVEAYNAGTVTQETFIWCDGMDDWKPLSEVDSVVSALHANAGPAGAPVAAESSYRSSVEDPPAPAPAAYEAPAMLAAAPAVPVEEPRRAAVAKREPRGRDLFGGGGGGGEDVQTSAPVVPRMMAAPTPPADDASKLTGERNENSVLFSLAVLTKDADRAPENVPAPASSSGSSARSSEDSGLIDLKALAAKAESMRPAASAEANAFASPLGLGLGLGSPQGGGLGSPLGGEAPQKSKLPLLIGGGAGVAILLVLGIVIGVKLAGGSGSASAAPSASAMIAPVTTATAEPTATASATAEPTASAAPSASAAPKPKPVAVAPAYHPPAGGTPAKPAGGATTPPAGGAPTPPPPKKPGNDCGCNGDLMCLMKCSTH